MSFVKESVTFFVLFLIAKKLTDASFVLSPSPAEATVGIAFTFTCRTNIRALFFTRGSKNQCTIIGNYSDGTCAFLGDYNTSYTYSCNNFTGEYNLTLPSTLDIEPLHGSFWICRPVSSAIKDQSERIELNIFVPITQVLLTTSTVQDKIEIIENTSQDFTCTTNAGRPPSRIQWYISGRNLTESAILSNDVCNSPCKDKIISSSVLQYSGNIIDNGNSIYCIASNINGQSVISKNISIIIWYPPSSPTITQTPQEPVDENQLITLTCEIVGGHPLASIVFQCNGKTGVPPTGSRPINKTVSTIQFTATKSDNGNNCTCIGSHPAWMKNKSSHLTLQIRYAPTTDPRIAQSPIGNVIAGQKVTLTCDISVGNPLPTIVWNCKDFTNVTPTGNPPTDKVVSSVERIVSRLDNRKECVCTGQHPLWTENREVKHLVHVYYPPLSQSITQETESPVDENQQITLMCEIIGGNPLATIYWQCDGISLQLPTESTSTNKTVSRIVFIAKGNYNGNVCSCIGSHPAWMANRTSNITLQIRYAPKFFPTVTQSPSGSIIEGNTIILTCEITGGNPLATIVWQCDDFTNVIQPEPLPNDKIVSSIMGNATRLDNGRECVCTGHHPLWTENKKTKHKMLVYYSATIEISNTEPIIVVENKTVDLVCTQVDGNPKNASFKWYRFDAIIGTNRNYTIYEATANDTGWYTCQGSNGFGHTSVATVEVIILYSPRISAISVLDGNTIAENGTAVLQCIVQSNPLPSIVWMKQGSLMVLSKSNNSAQSNLTIGNAGCLQTSNYTCKATNYFNNNKYIAMKHVEMFVKCSPRRYKRQEESTNLVGLEVGQNLTLVEHILAYPKGNVTWTFNQDKNSTDTILPSASFCSTSNIFEHRICFVRLNLTETDFGLYTAIVTNDIGDATFRSMVTPQGKPDPPRNITCTGRPYSALLHWESSFNGGDTQTFQIYMKKYGQGNFYTNGQHYHDPGRNVYAKVEIKKLSPGTTYQFIIRASNSYNFTLSDLASCNTTIPVKEDPQSTGAIAIGAGTGSSAAVIVLILIAVIFIYYRRRKRDDLHEQDKEPMKRSVTSEEDNDDDGLRENPLYVSSPQEADGAVYSVVDKHRQNRNNGKEKLSNDSSVYTEVVKTKKKDIKMKEIEMGCVYQNSADLTKKQTEEVYANSEIKSIVGQNNLYRPTKNKDGLIYADLDLATTTKGPQFVIRGLENRNQYAVIDLTKHAEPMPSDSDSDDDKTKKKIEEE